MAARLHVAARGITFDGGEAVGAAVSGAARRPAACACCIAGGCRVLLLRDGAVERGKGGGVVRLEHRLGGVGARRRIGRQQREAPIAASDARRTRCWRGPG